jgi:hypothetical protein
MSLYILDKLKVLRGAGVQILAVNGSLQVTGRLTDEDRAFFRENKPAILAVLSGGPGPSYPHYRVIRSVSGGKVSVQCAGVAAHGCASCPGYLPCYEAGRVQARLQIPGPCVDYVNIQTTEVSK